VPPPSDSSVGAAALRPNDLINVLSLVTQEALLVVAGEDNANAQRDYRCVWANRAAADLLDQPDGSLVGRSYLEFLPSGGQLYEHLLRCEQTGQETVGEADVNPTAAPVSRLAFRVIPHDQMLAVSLGDRSSLREARARADWLEEVVRKSAEVSPVAAAILRPIIIGDALVDLEFDYVNERGASLLGAEEAKVPGRRVAELVGPVDAKRFIDRIRGMWQTGVPDVFEMTAGMQRSGAWYRCQVVPLGDRIVIQCHDISGQRALDAVLKASEHRYRSLFETANEGIALVDLRGIYVAVNDAYAAMFGFSPSELLEVSSLDQISKDEHPKTLADARAAREGSQPMQRRQVRMLRRDGTDFWAFVATNVTRDRGGTVDGFLIMALDVDEQIRSADLLASSEARYRAIVENADVLIALIDRRGCLVFANDHLVSRLGLPREELIGRRALDFYVDPATVLRGFKELSAGLFDVSRSRTDLRCADGSQFPTVGSSVALRTPSGEFDGAVLVGADVTALVEQDNVRREMGAALALAEQRERERLATDLHDGPVQTLTALSMRLGGALGSSPDPALLRDAEDLVTNTIRELRQALFQLSPPDLDTQTLGMCLLDRARNLLPQVAVRLDDRTRLPIDDRTILAMFRIGQEALVNVAKHAQATEVEISLFETLDWSILRITDNGVGTSSDRLTKRAVGHLGVSGMVERAAQLGGRCEVTSAVGEGTTVVLRIPTARALVGPRNETVT
jgi:PAS domain S-box-containing protein